MSNSQITKKQHFIPNFLIKRWRNDSNEILIVDKCGIPKKISFNENKEYFSELFLYEVPNKKINNLEGRLSKIEEKYAQLTNKIILNINAGVTFLEYASENDLALIETFNLVQVYRNSNYWSLLNENKYETLKYLEDLIDTYFKYTGMSRKEKNEKLNLLSSKIEEIHKREHMGNFNAGNVKYHLYKLCMSFDYFLTYTLNHFEYRIISFVSEWPIAHLGQFEISSNMKDGWECYVIPLSPKIGIVKCLRSDSDYKEHLRKFLYPFLNANASIEAPKRFAFAELKTFAKYSVIPFAYNSSANIFEDIASLEVEIGVIDKINECIKLLVK
jgi:phage terminase large subunit GpA-like protein